MTTKTRLQKLESAKPGQFATDNRLFTQEVRTESHKFFIDSVEVDEAKYKKELAAYLRIRENNNIPVEIVVNLSDGDQ
jgi:hypothetical protein